MKISARLSLRDDSKQYLGAMELWEKSQGQLRNALRNNEVEFYEEEGEAAFYGPKIDIKLIDAIGRPWQLSTVQFDFNLPARFGLEYIAADGSRRRPVMVHRALLGSVERFFGILVEHYAGSFPLWLAPVQVRVLTLSEAQLAEGKALVERLARAGLRADLDSRMETVGKKIRETTLEKIPYAVVLGPKDVAAGTLSVRLRDGRQFQGVKEGDFVGRLEKETRDKSPMPAWPS